MPVMIRNEKTLAKVEEIKKKLRIKTASGAIDHICFDYLPTKKELKETKKELSKLQDQYREMLHILKDKKHADFRFNDLLENLPEHSFF